MENKGLSYESEKHKCPSCGRQRSEAGAGEDDVVMLLLTDKELERAAKRADKNKEDLPKYFAIVQGSTEPIVKEEPVCLDDKDVAKPAKPAESKGFFGWLMGD